MRKINVEPTAEIIDEMSGKAQQLTRDLDRIADRMRRTGNLEYASEAQTTILAFVMNARLDLMVTRPIRALMQEDNQQ